MLGLSRVSDSNGKPACRSLERRRGLAMDSATPLSGGTPQKALSVN